MGRLVAVNRLALAGIFFGLGRFFERDFVLLCFALATGVGKTRLMGAFIAYLHAVYSVNNFFVLAPNLTIYNKLMRDFTPGTPKYVSTGLADFAQFPPLLITGDNYAQTDWSSAGLFGRVRINVFNISEINSEVRGGKEPKIKRFQEVLGNGYFQYLAKLPDLVLLMDESHRYRASAGVRVINELKPAPGLELTATPFVETSRGSTAFKNILIDYPLGRAMADGFVKEPAVVTQRDFNPNILKQGKIEVIKLEANQNLADPLRRQKHLEPTQRKVRGQGEECDRNRALQNIRQIAGGEPRDYRYAQTPRPDNRRDRRRADRVDRARARARQDDAGGERQLEAKQPLPRAHPHPRRRFFEGRRNRL